MGVDSCIRQGTVLTWLVFVSKFADLGRNGDLYEWIFQLQIDEKGVSLLLSPPVGDGKRYGRLS